MSTWRRKAIEAAPDIRDKIEQAWSPMAAWIELRLLFDDSVRSGDMEKSRRIIDYARYCLSAPDKEVNTAVAVGFIEHLADDEWVRNRLPELITAQDAREWREILAYHSDAHVVDALIEACRSYRPRL
ncbi:hypothetical protein G6L37_09325 [Agrobacterium rubi]|uniref:DUF7674 family protein n=1 Tax=Agrobacterium rubi TaxID=28099 RepID=UPI001571DAB6|nr:hypothetical protein [Agrobacterium rubi]NTF06363.1 hypothetical protein [Agrobacterium rubi]NTF18604.1 hypothetical protein [Agrobacterium rubi]NTF25568.1 hypothetical protein [Agrobacterium rubi]